jgi:hypothetical protein
MAQTVFLSDGDWRLWEQFSLRGTGFPAAGVLRLAPDGLAAAADKFGAADALSGPDWTAFEESFDTAAVATAHVLQEIAAMPSFRAAVAWQNRAVLGSGIAPFLSWVPSAAGRTSMPRQREELVANYWQRYCVKNDTIGFFGPVGWGRWDLSRSGVAVEPGEGLIAHSDVYFSSWALDTLAKTINADPGLREWVPPRRMPFVRVAEGRVTQPGRPPQEIDPLAYEVLALCDGTRPLAALAREVSARTGREVSAEETVTVLESLRQRRWIAWRLEVPASTYPERDLRATLERVGDADVRERALAKVDAVVRGRDRVRAAGGDPDALSAALAALETEFVELTDVAAHREKGARTAPCRALVYSDCRRSATVSVGSALLAELTPLALCLTAARWMTNRFAELVGARVREAYERLRDRQTVVDLGSLWMECLPVPHPDSVADALRVQDELRARWAGIIDAQPGARRVHLSSADIGDRVREAFAEQGSGWNLARYISPDVLIVADDAAAVQRGDFGLVLGELHVGANTIAASLFVHQHPDIPELLAETTTDFPGPRVLPMLPKEQPPRYSARSRPSLNRPQDYHVGLVEYTGDPNRPRSLNGADVLVEDRDGRLVLVLPDGVVFDVLDVFGNAMTNRVMDKFTLRADADHSPRVTVDRMVVARETWRFGAAGLDFAAEKQEAKRFVRARQWRDEHELPRFVFVISPAEPRPFYVDFDSPVYVNIVAKAARRLARKDPDGVLTFSEMMPTPEQVWLTDDRGEKYTSELRFVAVDQTTRDGART